MSLPKRLKILLFVMILLFIGANVIVFILFCSTQFKRIRWNIDDSNAVAMPNTLLYTSYMSRIVATRCHAEGLGEFMVQYTT